MVMPAPDEYLPGSQVLQIVRPEPVRYEPAAQAVHGVVVPGDAVYVPSTQNGQAARPEPVLYVPAAQDRQAACMVIPSPDEYFPSVHFWHWLASDNPVALEYVPAGHWLKVNWAGVSQ